MTNTGANWKTVMTGIGRRNGSFEVFLTFENVHGTGKLSANSIDAALVPKNGTVREGLKNSGPCSVVILKKTTNVYVLFVCLFSRLC